MPFAIAATSKGQATITKAIRDHLGLKAGDRVKFRSSRRQRRLAHEAPGSGAARDNQGTASRYN
jgi:AbrB family looped-hinge helix DNA binding protein